MPLSAFMMPSRCRILTFLISTVVLLGGGYAAGYANAYSRFYSTDALLDRELVHMDFNSRLLHYSLVGQQANFRRELVRRLQGEVVFVSEQIEDGLTPESQVVAKASMANARTVIDGHPVAQK